MIGHQMAALIGFQPKLCGLNHWLSAALDTDPVHLRCPANAHTHTQTDIITEREPRMCAEARAEQI